MTFFARALATVALSASAASAQQASFVYRLGKDTAAIEQFTRTANHLTGDVVSRNGPAVTHAWYDAAIGGDGRVTSVTYRFTGADGNPLPGRPSEMRYAVRGDSVTRVAVWRDSTQSATLAGSDAVPFVAPGYGMLEVAFAALRRRGVTSATFPIIGVGLGSSLPPLAMTVAGGDTIRLSTGMFFLVDRAGILRLVDGSESTGKLIASRTPGGLDIVALMSKMTPLGPLSPRGTARASFQTQTPGGIVIVDYGRPQVRGRSVWGGLLIPADTIWRLGANEATHFATSRDLAFGDVTVPAGLYTLFLYNAKSGPLLVVNRQVGQWGTAYDQTRDLARIPLAMSPAKEFQEEFTITVRQLAPNRGALEIAWGAQMGSAQFVVK